MSDECDWRKFWILIGIFIVGFAIVLGLILVMPFIGGVIFIGEISEDLISPNWLGVLLFLLFGCFLMVFAKYIGPRVLRMKRYEESCGRRN